MPQYAPDLVDYLEELGEDGVPTKALSDPALLQRCLSREAPIVLVGRVAAGLEDVDSHPDIHALSTYERGRVMSALDRREDAVALYEEALAEDSDDETRGYLLVNLGNEVESPYKEALFHLAIAEGHHQAFLSLGMFFWKQGSNDRAIQALTEGVRSGVAECVPLLGEIFVRVYGNDSDGLGRALTVLYALARESGIPDVVETPFDQFATRLLVRPDAGEKPLNVVALQRPLLRANRPLADGDR